MFMFESVDIKNYVSQLVRQKAYLVAAIKSDESLGASQLLMTEVTSL